MMGDDSDAGALADCVDEFDRAIRQLAWALAARVIADECAARRREAPRARGRSAATVEKATPTMIAPSPAIPAQEPQPASMPAAIEPGGRRRWTRETVIAALCEWLISGIVEASFLRRHGQPGLVAAATRIFGRFDSALNVANLYLAKQYPDGPPSRRNTPPVARASARRAPERSELADEARAHEANGAPANGAPANGAPANGTPANGTPAAITEPGTPASRQETAASSTGRSAPA